MNTRDSILLMCLAHVLLPACKSGDDSGGDGTGDTTAFSASSFGHSATDPSLGSMTFTNSSDPTDPTDPTDPSSPTQTSDPTDPTATTGTNGTGESTGAADTTGADGSSTGIDPTAESDTSSGGACCESQDGAGCGDATIEACVCATESFCCDVQWDVVCTVQAVRLGCTECPGIGGGGDCCAAHGNPGCDDDVIEQCVCNEDYVCCLEPWDDLCVGHAMNDCAAC